MMGIAPMIPAACSVKTLRFVVPGRVASNNRVIRHFGRAVKSADAKDFITRVASCAVEAVVKTDWRFPACCRVTLVHCNGRLDTDNIAKAALDALKGIVFPDDKRKYVRETHLLADADGGPEYLEILVEPCEPLPAIIARKCHACLQQRRGPAIKPHLCGVCRQRQRGIPR